MRCVFDQSPRGAGGLSRAPPASFVVCCCWWAEAVDFQLPPFFFITKIPVYKPNSGLVGLRLLRVSCCSCCEHGLGIKREGPIGVGCSRMGCAALGLVARGGGRGQGGV